jgi:hypothetical protein
VYKPPNARGTDSAGDSNAVLSVPWQDNQTQIVQGAEDRAQWPPGPDQYQQNPLLTPWLCLPQPLETV